VEKSMKQQTPTIAELSATVGQLFRDMSTRNGLDPQSAISVGMASGLDVALTMIESSTATPFQSLSLDAATEIRDYFLQEAAESKANYPQISIWYFAWAKVIEKVYC
jgi:hypothetical protein